VKRAQTDARLLAPAFGHGTCAYAANIGQVEWESEKECFQGIMAELASFYCFRASDTYAMQ
jgi:hypothetical protein